MQHLCRYSDVDRTWRISCRHLTPAHAAATYVFTEFTVKAYEAARVTHHPRRSRWPLTCWRHVRVDWRLPLKPRPLIRLVRALNKWRVTKSIHYFLRLRTFRTQWRLDRMCFSFLGGWSRSKLTINKNRMRSHSSTNPFEASIQTPLAADCILSWTI